MNYKIIRVPFPFDDLSFSKIRPAVCLTGKIGKFNHIVIAFITSRLPDEKLFSDIKINPSPSNGLKAISSIRLHRIITIPEALVKRQLGNLGKADADKVRNCLRKLFDID